MSQLLFQPIMQVAPSLEQVWYATKQRPFICESNSVVQLPGEDFFYILCQIVWSTLDQTLITLIQCLFVNRIL